MGDVNQPWRSDQLAQAMADRLVEQAANPFVTLAYGRFRPLVHATLADIFEPIKVPNPQKGRRKKKR